MYSVYCLLMSPMQASIWLMLKSVGGADAAGRAEVWLSSSLTAEDRGTDGVGVKVGPGTSSGGTLVMGLVWARIGPVILTLLADGMDVALGPLRAV